MIMADLKALGFTVAPEKDAYGYPLAYKFATRNWLTPRGALLLITTEPGGYAIREDHIWNRLYDAPLIAGPFDTLEAAVAAYRLIGETR